MDHRGRTGKIVSGGAGPLTGWACVRLVFVLAGLTAPLALSETSTSEIAPSSEPKELKAVADVLFFTADDGIHGRELWRWETGEGHEAQGQASLVTDIVPGPESSNPHYMFSSGGFLYFIAGTAEIKEALWVCGPREMLVRPVIDSESGQQICSPRMIDIAHGLFYFIARGPKQRWSLWASVPGESRAEIAFVKAGSIVPDALGLVLADGALLFNMDDAIWQVRSKNAEPAMLRRDTGACFVPGISPLPRGAFFLADDKPHGLEPWVTDGTSAGTFMLRDINSGQAPSCRHINPRVLLGDNLFFGADDGRQGIELWKTNGTPEGTQLVADINPGGPASDPQGFRRVGDGVYFVADDGQHGPELWKTNGTSQETKLVIDLIPGREGSNPWSPVEFSERLWFCAKSPAFGEEVFSSDGTERGTLLLRDIAPGPQNSGPNDLTPLGDRLFFTCDDGIHGEELWMTDGTEQGTVLAADVWPVRVNPSSSPTQLTSCQNKLFFTVDDGQHGEELWRSDGTTDGTTLVRDIAEGKAASAPRNLTAAKAQLFFTARASDSGREIWVTDGTDENTKLVKDIREGPVGSDPDHLLFANELLYFTADDGAHGRELWCSDGSLSGTVLVKDITERPDATSFVTVFELWGRVYFYTKDKLDDVTLWTTDGTQAGTQRLLEVPMPFPSWDPDNPTGIGDLFSGSNKSSSIPEYAFLVPIVYPCAEDEEGAGPLVVGKTTYFAAQTDRYGSELCVTDGTLKGTRLLCDAFPGPSSSSPAGLTLCQHHIYFLADDPREGRVFWHTDGTPGGTHVIIPRQGNAPISPIKASGFVSVKDVLFSIDPTRFSGQTITYRLSIMIPKSEGDDSYATFGLDSNSISQCFHLTSAGDHLFFTFDDGMHGEELWGMRVTPPEQGSNPPLLVKDIL